MNKNLYEVGKKLYNGQIDTLNFSARSKIERELYIGLNDFTLSKFDIDLNSFSTIRKATLLKELHNKANKDDLEIIEECYKIHSMILELYSFRGYGDDDINTDKKEDLKALGHNIIDISNKFKQN